MFDQALLDEIKKYYADPLGYVMFCFPWDTDPSIQVVPLPEKYKKRFPNATWGPDEWACDFLEEVGQQVRDKQIHASDVTPLRFSTASGHGIGKSTLVAWLTKWILDTRPESVGSITANTVEQLRTKTWAEVGKWHAISLTESWFKFSNGRGSMSLKNTLDKNIKWGAEAKTCREENSESFAGQHAPLGTSFYIFDEASNIPQKIFEVREGGLVTGSPMVFDFGNPTRNSGAFYENCVGKFAHRYTVRSIDSRTTYLAAKSPLHKQWIDDYGIDSDFVKVRILGQFPSVGLKQFIPIDMIEMAMMRQPVEDSSAPLILGVDVARHGTNETVIYPRIGFDASSWKPWRYRGLNTTQVTGKVVEAIRFFKSLGKKTSAIFVDGTGVGGGVVDQLRQLGYDPIEVQSGGGCIDKDTYRYKSDEMWGRMREAILKRLVLPQRNSDWGNELFKQLSQREFDYTKQGNKIHLESKDSMSDRDLESPDIADALALTFASEINDTAVSAEMGQPMFSNHEYDPYERV